MSNFLINCSNLRVGGGVQVADSVCRELPKFKQHNFIVIYSKALISCAEDIKDYSNIKAIRYDIPKSLWASITCKNYFLDDIVRREDINAVLTIFGPSRWKPKVNHVCGFARPHLVIPESPFWRQLNLRESVKFEVRNILMRYSFGKCARSFWSESSFISTRLKDIFPKSRVYTVSNNYNQVFDDKTKWDTSVKLAKFDGMKLLTISANYPHKNLQIIIPTIKYLIKAHPNINFRFVLTLMESQFPCLTKEEKEHLEFLGPVSIDQCPFLYEQCDAMFLPTLLECFSASYTEAMKMRKPILTSNLDFAKALCGDAAKYFDPVSEESVGESIYELAMDKELVEDLVSKGTKQLVKFDSYSDRAKKLIGILEREC